MDGSANNNHLLSSRWPPCQNQATIEDVTENDDVESLDDSSAESTPTDESKRNSFFENMLSEDQLIAHIAGFNIRGRPASTLLNTTIGQRINQLVVVKNFAQVMPNVYRSAFPDPENFSFLRMLGLKSILTLVPEEYSEAHQHFVSVNHIKHFRIGIEPNKSPLVTINSDNMAAALGVVLDPSNHPLLIHCNKGKHRTGCVVACSRKILGWSSQDIIAEYRKYAGAKARELDERYIENFDQYAHHLMLRREQKTVPEPFIESPASSFTLSTRLRS